MTTILYSFVWGEPERAPKTRETVKKISGLILQVATPYLMSQTVPEMAMVLHLQTKCLRWQRP